MGIFDFLFGGKSAESKIDIVPDRIWMTTEAKFAGLMKEARARSVTETSAILLVGHFSDVLEKLDELVSETSWETPCHVVPASNLNAELASSLRVDEAATIDIIVGERHPLPSVDDQLKDFAKLLPCRCRFSHHVSLDDAVMKVFAGDWVKDVLKRLGMPEAEAIQSQMVSNRIRKAQEKIEGRAFTSLEARSASEWLTKNCPDLTSP